MNELIAISKSATISSKLISEITGKRHADVMRDVKNLIEQLGNEKGECIFALSSYFGDNQKLNPMYELTKKEALLLASGYNPILRLKIIDKLEEAEGKLPKIPQTYSEALRLASEQAEQIEKQAVLISEQAPKVIAFENVIDSANTYTLDSVSDILNIGRTTLASLLEKKKWKTIKETHGTSSTRYAEENGYAKTIYEYIKIGKNEFKTKRFVLKKKGLDKLIKEMNNE